MNKILLFFLIFIVNCSQPTLDQRNNLIEELNLNEFRKNTYTTNYFNIFALEKIKNDKKLVEDLDNSIKNYDLYINQNIVTKKSILGVDQILQFFKKELPND